MCCLMSSVKIMLENKMMNELSCDVDRLNDIVATLSKKLAKLEVELAALKASLISTDRRYEANCGQHREGGTLFGSPKGEVK